MRQRIDELDIVKTIGIILMVLGHCIATPMIHSSFFFNFIYLFHMPVFIICSGFLFDQKKTKGINNAIVFLKSKLIHLFVPYLLINLLFLFTNNLQIIPHHGNEMLPAEYIKEQPFLSFREMVHKIPGLLTGNNTFLGGATWFLFYLFVSILLYYFLSFVLEHIKWVNDKFVIVIKGTAIVIFFVGCFIADRCHFSVWGHELYLTKRVSLFLLLLFCGELFKLLRIFDSINRYSTFSKCIIIIISLVILFILANFGSVNIYSYRITDPLFFLICSICGWVFLFVTSSLLCRFIAIKRISHYIGSRTIFIVGFHLLAFRIITWFIVYIKGMDSSFYMSYPVLPNTPNSFLLLVYLLSGVLFPLAVKKESSKIMVLIKGGNTK